jgi:hypothetical protein
MQPLQKISQLVLAADAGSVGTTSTKATTVYSSLMANLQIKKLGQPEIKQPNPPTRRDQGGAQIDGFEGSHPHRNVCSQIIGEFKLFSALNLTFVHAISMKAAGTQSPAAEPALNASGASRGLFKGWNFRAALPHLKAVKPQAKAAPRTGGFIQGQIGGICYSQGVRKDHL